MTSAFQTSVVGSFPRPRWLINAFEKREKGDLSEKEFELLLNDAIKLTIKEQELAGLDFITDGEQERTSFVGFVGQRIPGMEVKHIDVLNLRALELLKEMKTQLTYYRAVVADKIRDADLATEDYKKAKSFTEKPIKVTLPAPYLVMRESWHRRLSRDAYPHPEDFGYEYAKVLRKNIGRLRDAGATLIQLDEPMLGDLTEAGEKPDRYHRALEKIYGQKYRGFKEEVRLAVDLANASLQGRPSGVKVVMHMDRWPNADSPFFNQGYERLLPDLLQTKVDQFALEYTSPGCGDPRALVKEFPKRMELAMGCVSVRDREVETPETIAERVERVVPILGPERVWLVPDCGFAPGMTRPFPRQVAFAKLKSMTEAAKRLRRKHRGE